MSSGRHAYSIRLTPGFERLSDRLLLSVNNSMVGPSGEGENHVVHQADNVVFVFGDNVENDSILLTMGTTQHQLRINDEEFEFDASVVDEIVLSGLGGDDELTLIGSQLDDQVELSGTDVKMLSTDYVVRAKNMETTRVFGASGEDHVMIHDTAGDDELYMHSNFSAFVNDRGDIFKVSGMERVEAFSRRGGHDEVKFFDSAEDDRFVSRSGTMVRDSNDVENPHYGSAYMVGESFWNYANGFARVDAYHRTGGVDEARVYGTQEDDHVTATPDLVTVSAGVTSTGSSFTVTGIHGFRTTRTYGEGGNDLAELHGQQHYEDRFVSEPASAYMYSTGNSHRDVASGFELNFPPIVASNIVVGFEHIKANGGDDTDRAELRGTSDDDQFVGLPDIAQLTAGGTTVAALNFRVVRAIGNGGEDEAFLQGSDANETYISNTRFAYLEGGDYLNYVSNDFNVIVDGRGGGFDYANPQEYAGPNRDYVLFDGPQFLIYGPERRERIHGFDEGRGDAERAGWQVMRPIEHPFTLGGSHDQNDAPNETQFEEIQAWAGADLPNYELHDDGFLRLVTDA